MSARNTSKRHIPLTLMVSVTLTLLTIYPAQALDSGRASRLSEQGDQSNPIPVGTRGELTYKEYRMGVTVNGTNWNVSKSMCEKNYTRPEAKFGCSGKKEDPESPWKWISIEIKVENLGTKELTSISSWNVGVLIGGANYRGEAERFKGFKLNDSLFDKMLLKSGDTGTRTIYVWVPKSLGQSTIVVRFTSKDKATTHFQA